MYADIIIKNAKCITVNNEKVFEWLAIKDKKIIAIDNGKKYNSLINETTIILDAKGKSVLPGFIDSHFHLVQTAMNEEGVNLHNVSTFEEIGKKIKKANLKYVFSKTPFDPNDYDPTGYVIKIISLLFEYYSEENKKYLFEFGKSMGLYVLENIDAKYRLEEKKDYRDKTYYNIIFNVVSYTYSNLYYIPIKALKYLEDYYDEKSFTDAFLIKNMVTYL